MCMADRCHSHYHRGFIVDVSLKGTSLEHDVDDMEAAYGEGTTTADVLQVCFGGGSRGYTASDPNLLAQNTKVASSHSVHKLLHALNIESYACLMCRLMPCRGASARPSRRSCCTMCCLRSKHGWLPENPREHMISCRAAVSDGHEGLFCSSVRW